MSILKVQLIRVFQQASQYIALDENGRVFIGEPGNMKKHVIESQHHDMKAHGYYIRLKGEADKLFIPAGYKSGVVPMFHGKPMEELDHHDEDLAKKLNIPGVIAYQID